MATRQEAHAYPPTKKLPESAHGRAAGGLKGKEVAGGAVHERNCLIGCAQRGCLTPSAVLKRILFPDPSEATTTRDVSSSV